MTNQGMKIGQITKNKVVYKIMQQVLVFLLMFSQLALFGWFLNGAIVLAGKQVSLIRAVELTLDMFYSFNWGGVGNSIIGVTYFIIVGIIIKNFVSSFAYIKNIFIGEKDKSTLDAMIYYYDRSQKGFFGIIVFMVIARMFTEYDIGSSVVAPLIAAAVVSLVAKFILVLWESESVFVSAVNLLYGGFVYTCAFLFVVNVCNIRIPEFFLSIKYFLSSSSENAHYKMLLDALYCFLAAPIFYFILQIMALNLINDLLYYFDYKDSEVKARARGCVVTSAVFLCVALVVAIYNVGTLSAVVFGAVKGNLLLFMVTIAILLAFYFPSVSSMKISKPVKAKSYEEEIPSKQTVPENDNVMGNNTATTNNAAENNDGNNNKNTFYF